METEIRQKPENDKGKREILVVCLQHRELSTFTFQTLS